jgi:CheY-like chemotaxis protein
MFTVKADISHKPSKYIPAAFDTVDLKGKKVLIADDNKTNRFILQTQLEQWGIKTFVASSAKHALEILSAEKGFDLLITDMEMPEMDGVGLAKAVKKDQDNLPVIMLSSIGDNSRKKYPGLFSAILTKPVKQSQLGKSLQIEFHGKASAAIPDVKSARLLDENFASQFPLRILVAEDNLINQKLIDRMLSKLGYQFQMAQNGLEVLEKLDNESFEVIFMDVQMPKMDGFEATLSIRTTPFRQPFIVAMTANAGPDDRELCLSKGMDDYMAKPMKTDVLIAMLKKAHQFVKDDLI